MTHQRRLNAKSININVNSLEPHCQPIDKTMALQWHINDKSMTHHWQTNVKPLLTQWQTNATHGQTNDKTMANQ
jgi:hypothetical protein